MADLFGNIPARPKWNSKLQNDLIETISVEIFSLLEKKHNINDIKSELHDFFLQYDLAFTETQFKQTFETKFNSIFDIDFENIYNKIIAAKENILNNEIRWWVLQNYIKPEFEVGDFVIFDNEKMEIFDINHKYATYLLAFENGFRYVNFEQVKPVK